MKIGTSLFAAVSLAVSSAVWAQQDKLDIGHTAPGLDIETWVKGSETTLAAGKVYVVEFWATWCGPCKRSIPHLTALQKEYADDGLVIIGISTEELEKVRPFVRNQSANMSYTVAVDRNDSTSRAWMGAAQINTIPTAFIVDRTGKIAHIGNPLEGDFDSVIKKVMSGRYDVTLQVQVDPMIRAARKARKERNWRVALKQYDEAINVDGRIFASTAIERFEMMAVDMNDKAGAYKYAQESLIGKTFANDAEALRMLAEKIATDPKIDPKMRDLDVALAAAEASQRIASNDESQSLNTLALVRFNRGELDQAVQLQRQAWMQAPPKYKANYHRTLTSYQEASQRTSMMNKPK